MSKQDQKAGDSRDSEDVESDDDEHAVERRVTRGEGAGVLRASV